MNEWTKKRGEGMTEIDMKKVKGRKKSYNINKGTLGLVTNVMTTSKVTGITGYVLEIHPPLP